MIKGNYHTPPRRVNYYINKLRVRTKLFTMFRSSKIRLILFIAHLFQVRAFNPSQPRCQRIETALPAKCDGEVTPRNNILERRLFIQACSVGTALISCDASYASAATLSSISSQVKQARSQLDPVSSLIKEEKWDSVRAILITPPLSDCWSKSSKLLSSYAKAIGDELPDGDEFAALELKEEALDHLRFLDMAAYNNVFNPIKTEGKSGATKELISSYYEDPVNQYKDCVRVFDGLIELSDSK
jgi:hypothetical protein